MERDIQTARENGGKQIDDANFTGISGNFSGGGGCENGGKDLGGDEDFEIFCGGSRDGESDENCADSRASAPEFEICDSLGGGSARNSDSSDQEEGEEEDTLLWSSYASYGEVDRLPRFQNVIAHSGECLDLTNFTVFRSGDVIYDALLLMVDISKNINSFFHLQVLQGSDQFLVFQRWGRVGCAHFDSHCANIYPTSDDAIKCFEKKFLSKTGNSWSNNTSGSFVRQQGKFCYLDRDGAHQEPVACSLSENVQSLLQAVVDISRARLSVSQKLPVSMSSEFPFGPLSRHGIARGIHILHQIDEVIKLNKHGNVSLLADICSQFYAIVPIFSRFDAPPIIHCQKKCRHILKVLKNEEKLSNPPHFTVPSTNSNDAHMSQSSKLVHPLDHVYHSLKCRIQCVQSGPELRMLQNLIASTHAESHSHYRMIVDAAYSVSRDEETIGFEPHKRCINRRLLFHGTRSSNIHGILSQGLKIAPAWAPCTGYMFGKGIYFGEVSSKSANYCFANESNPNGFMLICEVALGNQMKLFQADYAASSSCAQEGFDSVKGVGKRGPSKHTSKFLHDGTRVCMGPIGVEDDWIEEKSGALMYSEHVVFDTSRIRLRYVLYLKFEFDGPFETPNVMYTLGNLGNASADADELYSHIFVPQQVESVQSSAFSPSLPSNLPITAMNAELSSGFAKEITELLPVAPNPSKALTNENVLHSSSLEGLSEKIAYSSISVEAKSSLSSSSNTADATSFVESPCSTISGEYCRAVVEPECCTPNIAHSESQRLSTSENVEGKCFAMDENPTPVKKYGSGSKYQKLLFTAARNGDQVTLQHLIRLGADINCRNSFGKCASHIAIDHDHFDFLRAFVESTQVDLRQHNYCGSSLDFYLVFRYRTHKNSGFKDQKVIMNILKYLIHSGACINHAKFDNCCSLRLYRCRFSEHDPVSCFVCPLLFLTRQADYNGIKELIEAGFDIKYCKASVSEAIKQRNSRCLKMFLDSGFDLETHPAGFSIAIDVAALSCLKIMTAIPANSSSMKKIWRLCFDVACERGRVKCLKIIMQQVSQFEAYDASFSPCLSSAAKNGYCQCVDLLVKFGVDINHRDNLGRCAGHYAAQSGSAKCLQMLIDAGWDVNDVDSSGHCALYFAAQSLSLACLKVCMKHINRDLLDFCVKRSCLNGQPDVLLAYIHVGVDVARYDLVLIILAGMLHSEPSVKSGEHLTLNLKSADYPVYYGDPGDMRIEAETSTKYSLSVYHLISAGININLCSANGTTFLLHAAEYGIAEGVRILIACRGDVNICNHEGRTPLLAASEHGFLECVEILIASKADINHCDCDGRSSVLLSSERGHLECLYRLLSAGGSAHQIDNLGRSPLLVAAIRAARCGTGQSLENDKAASALLYYGANVESVAKYLKAVQSSILHNSDGEMNRILTTIQMQLSLLEVYPTIRLSSRKADVVSSVLRGNMDVCLSERHRFRKRLLRFFVSSTFDDTSEERLVLLSDVMPKVQMRAQRLGFDVVLSEMRFGIRDNDDHKASEICISELHRCFRDSVGICYFLICGDKYGFRPMPRIIPQPEMHLLLGHMNPDEQKLALDLYSLDENAISSDGSTKPEFLLKHASESMSPSGSSGSKSGSDLFWRVKYPLLVSAMRKAAMLQWPAAVVEINDAKSSHPIKRYFVSITEAEAYQGLFRLEDDDKPNKCFVVQRTLLARNGQSIQQMIPTTAKLKDYVDLFDAKLDSSAANQLAFFLKNVKDVSRVLDSNQYIEYPPLTWVDCKGIDPLNDDHRTYLQAFSTDSINCLTSSILKAHRCMNQEPNQLMDECLHHIMFATDKFVPFEDSFAANQDFFQMKSYIESDVSNGCIFVVHGKPGCGKTFMLSQAVTLAAREVAASMDSVVIARFIGTSTLSSRIDKLLFGVCYQIHAIIGSDPPPLEYDALTSYFVSALLNWKNGRLLLVLDSLDQLDDSNGGRQLKWLPVSGLSPNVRLVVSTADDDASALDGRSHQCLSILQSKLHHCLGSGVQSRNILRLSPVANFSKLVLDIMGRKGRKLSPTQLAILENGINPSIRTPLVASILANVFEDLPSSSMALPGILFNGPLLVNPNVRDIIIDMFKKLELRHGKIFVKALLSYLTLAKDGLSESELAEILSLNDDVLADIYQWWVPPLRTIPSSPLTMLLSDLRPYLSHRGFFAEGSDLLGWYHKQFSEAVRFLYFGDSSFVKSVHSELADFFCGVWAGRKKPYKAVLCDAVQKKFPGEVHGDRLVRQQPLSFRDTSDIWSCTSNLTLLNLRRCSEAAFHLISAERFDDAARELCDINAVCARLKCGHGSDLVHFLEILAASRIKFVSNDLIHVVVDYLFWIKRDLTSLLSFPEDAIISSCSKLHSSSIVRQEFMQKVWPWILSNHDIITSEFGPNQFIPCVYGNISHDVNGCVSVFNQPSQVNAVVSHPSKQLFACGMESGVIVVCFLNGTLVCSFEGHLNGVSSLSWSHTGDLLASGSFDSTIRIWDVLSSTCLHVLKEHSSDVQAIQWSPVYQSNTLRILSGSVDSTVRLWDIMKDNATCLKILDHSSAVLSLCWSPDGLFFASSCWDGSVHVWDASSLLRIFELKGHTDATRCISWSPDGSKLVSGSRDATVRIWNLIDKSQTAVLQNSAAVNCAVTSVLWSPCGRWIFSATRDSAIRQWCTSTWSCLSTRDMHSGSVLCMTTVPGNRHLVLSSSADRSVRLWNSESMLEVLDSVQCKVRSLCWGPFSHTLWCGGLSGSVFSFNSDLLEFKIRSSDIHVPFSNVSILCMTSSCDGSFIAAGYDNDHICIFDLKASVTKVSARFACPNTSAVTISFSLNDVMVASGHPDNVVRIWDARSIQILLELNVHCAWVLSVHWNPSWDNPMRLVSGSVDSTICILDLWNDSTQALLNGCCSDKIACSEGPISCVRWSPDGLRIASSCWDGSVHVWDASSLLRIFELKGHTDATRCISWSPDGSKLVSGSRDATVRIWNVSTDPLSPDAGNLTLSGAAHEVMNVEISPCGTRIAACFSDSSLCVWYINSKNGIMKPKPRFSSSLSIVHPTTIMLPWFRKMAVAQELSCVFAKYNDTPLSICHLCNLPLLESSVSFLHLDTSDNSCFSYFYHQSCLLANHSLLSSNPIELSHVHPQHRSEFHKSAESIKANLVLSRFHFSNYTEASSQLTVEHWWHLWSRLCTLPTHVLRDLLSWNGFFADVYSESREALGVIATDLLFFGNPRQCLNCGNKLKAVQCGWICSSQFSNWAICLASCCPDLVTTEIPCLPDSFQRHFPDFLFDSRKNVYINVQRSITHQSWIIDAFHGNDVDIERALSVQSAIFIKEQYESSGLSAFSAKYYHGSVFGECSLDPSQHYVIVQDGYALTANLVHVDAFRNENIFFKLQVVVKGIPSMFDDFTILMPMPSKFKCYLICVSGSLLQSASFNVDVSEFCSANEAISCFHTTYERKTGQPWNPPRLGDKMIGKFFHVNLADIGFENSVSSIIERGELPIESTYESNSCVAESIFFFSKYSVVLPKVTSLPTNVFPLGLISHQALVQAQQILLELQSFIHESLGKSKLQKILHLSNQYFSLFPCCFQNNHLPLLCSGLLIEFESKRLRLALDSLASLCPKVSGYHTYGCSLPLKFGTKSLHPADKMFTLIAQCIKCSQSSSHSWSSIEVVDVLKFHHHQMNQNFEKWFSTENHQLLWLGAPSKNIGEILQHGLQLKKPVPAHHSRHSIVDGIHLTEVAPHASLCCRANPDHPFGFLLLVRAALGKEFSTTKSDLTLTNQEYKKKGCAIVYAVC